MAQDRKADKRFPELHYQRWSGSINVPDPVAISVGNDGEVFVTQTQRRKIQDLDIRAHRAWVPADVGFTSVDQKRAFYHKMLAIGGDQQYAAKQIQDVNQDGQYDWRDLTVISERIHRLADTDGDGKADETSVFAEGFQTEVTGIAAGVLAYQGNVYATIAPDLWKLTDTDGDHVADQREILATGFGLHIAYAGHDMHGLMIGPDGKLYWSIGDKGISVTTSDGRRHFYPNQGGVMRCNLDGSDFEVFAHGLRNVQEFAFDAYGNLFGVDNDADQPGERERFVWIVDQMDAGWRCNYQYRSGKYNPWTDERLWETAGAEHAAYLIPPISYYVDGPAGFKFNPGAALSSTYRDFFFITSAPNGNQFAFRSEPAGDSFRMVDAHRIGKGVPIVGLAFGPDGGLYGADWGGGYPLTQTGSVQRIDVAPASLTDSERNDRQSVARWLTQDLSEIESNQLSELLAHIDQRVRLHSQFELVVRKETSHFTDVLANHDNPLARVHAIWGLGQLIRNGDAKANALRLYLSDRDAKIRMVATKVLGECHYEHSEDFIALLDDSDLHVRVHAALALGRCPTPAAVPKLIELANRTPFDHHYLRHAIATAMASCASEKQLAALSSSSGRVAKLCAVVALRRLRSSAVANYLTDPSLGIAAEAALAIHDDDSILQAMPKLAAALDQDRLLSVPMAIRAINANFRLGGVEESRRLLRFASNPNQSEAMRAEACEALADWLDPPVLDRVDGRSRILSSDRPLDRDFAQNSLVNLIRQSPSGVRVAAAKAARRLQLDLSAEAVMALASDQGTATNLRLEALDWIAEAKPNQLAIAAKQEILGRLSGDASPRIATRSLTVLSSIPGVDAVPVMTKRLRDGKLPVQQAALAGLAVSKQADADKAIAEMAEQFIAGSLEDGLKLDVYTAVTGRAADTPAMTSLLARMEATKPLDSLENSKVRGFALARDGGDRDRGERLFRTDQRLQCARCHRIGSSGSNIGPELTKIARTRDSDYLLRAVVYPSADIEPKYNVQSVLLADGTVVQGVLKSENEAFLILIDAKGEEVKLAVDDIEEVIDKKVSLMPDMTEVLSPQETRDIVAYLRSLR